MVISVKEVADGADTAAQGERLFAALTDALRATDIITVSFANVQTATSSFVNLAFVHLLLTLSLDEVKRRVRIVNSTRQINEMIRMRLTREAEAKRDG
ncbi:STAS-like domain-containing protein [Bradyrhizobium elkanii]|uniref:STAS-like domain-containing protein n=1 Tax=Bradyrhizobium elkanii TaxID=29448 RepID=UPI0006863542|nr:STAS-like domain-containing protein [Bradyrhizobium elkanii]